MRNCAPQRTTEVDHQLQAAVHDSPIQQMVLLGELTEACLPGYGRPPSALVASLHGWGQLQRSCLHAPL